MSEADSAQDHEAAEWAFRNRSRGELKFYRPGEPGYGPEICGCGDDMPDARRALGKVRCVICQQTFEGRQRHYR